MKTQIEQLSSERAYYRCTNESCGRFWESKKFLRCQTCGSPLKMVRLKEGKVEEVN